MINSSDRLNVQRVGRILRHKSPVLVFPYFKQTREEEIMKDILEGYNPELIIKLDANEINNVKDYI